MNPRLSVVMVSDYEPDTVKSWRDELALAEALSEQDISEPFEVILVESEAVRSQPVPDELYQLQPGLQLFYFDSLKSASLKDFGVTQALGRYIAVLESDCIPSTNWLRLLLSALTEGGYDVASGRTWYGDDTSYRRVLGLLHRSWDDPGHSGDTTSISNNGAIYRREVLQRFPYPDAVTPFLSAALRNDLILQAGHRFYYQRQALMQHAIGGLGFIWDYQRNKGHQSMGAVRRSNLALLPLKLGGKFARDMKQVSRLGGDYLRWFDWPLLPVVMLLEIAPFLAGMLDAVREVSSIPGSAYR